MTVSLALGCAFLAALSYGIGSVMQAGAVRHAEMRPNLDARLFVQLARQLPYVGGLALDLIGFAASVLALRTLPLFMVQSAIAGSVGVTAIGASIAFGVRLLRYERAALVALVVGFALLAVSALPEHAVTLGRPGRWLLVGGVGVVLVAGAFSARLDDRKAAIGLALTAGLAWAGTASPHACSNRPHRCGISRLTRSARTRGLRRARDAPLRHRIAARVLEPPSPLWHLATDPVALALAAYGVLGTLLFATALQRGSVTAAAALVFSVETVIPSIVGLAFLGDHARPHLGAVAVLGFIVTVGASIALARRSEPLPRDPEPE